MTVVIDTIGMIDMIEAIDTIEMTDAKSDTKKYNHKEKVTNQIPICAVGIPFIKGVGSVKKTFETMTAEICSPNR